jgi:hypothetical protein
MRSGLLSLAGVPVAVGLHVLCQACLCAPTLLCPAPCPTCLVCECTLMLQPAVMNLPTWGPPAPTILIRMTLGLLSLSSECEYNIRVSLVPFPSHHQRLSQRRTPQPLHTRIPLQVRAGWLRPTAPLPGLHAPTPSSAGKKNMQLSNTTKSRAPRPS